MLKQFIIWLVTKFLAEKDIIALIANKGFTENPRATIESLYRRVYDSGNGQSIIPFDTVAAQKISEGDLAGNVYIAVLMSLKTHLCNYSEFFNEVARIKGQSSVLKVKKELIELVRSNTAYTLDSDIALVAHVMQESYINPVVITEFLNNLGA